MLDPTHALHLSLVRIRDATGAIVGAGFLVAPDLVCTCAHVVADALTIPRETEQPPEQLVHLDFPFLGEAEVDACIQIWVRMEPNDGGGDIAVLHLTTNPPSSARPVRLLVVSNLSGRDFEAYGFPSTTNVGQYAYGILRDRLANGYVQLEGTTTQGYRVQQGYSGTPVWDPRGRGVVGMVIAEERTREAKVAFLIPNDLILRTCPEIKPITLHQLFTPLTDGLTGLLGSPLSGVEQFLRTYLGTPDAPAPFGGRQVQLVQLDRWLATPAQPYALLVAEAGRGKSALLAQWVSAVADELRAEVAFVPISIRFSTSLKSTTLSLLGARLRHLHSVSANPPRDAEAWLAEIDLYLREDHSAGPPLLIVLDGADEAADWIVGQDLRFPPEPGRGVRVLVSARPLADCDAAGWLRRLEWQGTGVSMELPLLDRAGVVEVLRLMGDPLAGLATKIDTVSELYWLSEGDPLLVRLYVDALCGSGKQAAFLKPEDLKHVKPGLEEYFDQWWRDQEWQWKKQGRDVASEQEDLLDFLRLCATALGPLLRDEVAAIAGGRLKSGSRLRRVATEAGRFIIGDGRTQGYTFSHPKLGAYFREEQMTELERSEWVQRFLDFGQHTLAALNSGKLDPRQAPPYSVRYYGAHLEQASAHPDLFDELVSEGWQRAWEALEGTYDGFLGDLMRAWKRAEAAGVQAQGTRERGRAIGRQYRYTLIVTSINTLVGKIPPALLKGLVARGVWTPIQGLVYALRILNEELRAEALTELAPYLPASSLQEALQAARAMTRGASRAVVLTGLAPHLPESQRGTVLQEALQAARAITGEEPVAHTYHLPVVSAQFGDLTRDISSRLTYTVELGQARAFTGLAPHLPASLLQEVLQAVRAFTSEELRAEALTGLAPHLPVSLLQEALQAARAITRDDSRAQALTGLAPHVKQLPVVKLYLLWCETLHVLVTRTRSDLLYDTEALAPVIEVLGEKEALITIVEAIIEVGKWFP